MHIQIQNTISIISYKLTNSAENKGLGIIN